MLDISKKVGLENEQTKKFDKEYAQGFDMKSELVQDQVDM